MNKPRKKARKSFLTAVAGKNGQRQTRKGMRMPFKRRLLLGASMMMLLFMVLAGVIIMTLAFNQLEKETQRGLDSALNGFGTDLLENHVQKALEHATLMSGNTQFALSVRDGFPLNLRRLYNGYFQSGQVDFFIAKNKDGPVILQGKQCSEISTFLATMIPSVSSGDRRSLTMVTGNERVGILLVASAPVLNMDEGVVGRITTGYTLNSPAYTAHIRRMYGMDASVFWKDVRISSSLDKDGLMPIGTRMDPSIAEKVLVQGKRYSGRGDVAGIPSLVAGVPIRDVNNEIIGALMVGRSMNEVLRDWYRISLTLIALLFPLATVGLLFLYRILDRTISQPVRHLTGILGNIAAGHIEEVPKEAFAGANDEFQALNEALESTVGEMVRYRERLDETAFCDDLTGFSNRARLQVDFDELMVDMAQFIRVHTRIGFLFLDMDDLKTVNDLYGHDIGDRLISVFSGWLMAKAESYSCRLYRIGGDEFLLMSVGEDAVSRLEKLAQELLEDRAPSPLPQRSTPVTASMGIAGFPEDGEDYRQLLKHAEIAMYHAKRECPGRWVRYDASMQVTIEEEADLEERFRKALDRNGFSLAYQPKISVKDHSWVGFEALARWNDADKGFIPPTQFIPLAERTGLIIPLGNWVLREACCFIRRLNARHGMNLSVSVNLSVLQLLEEGFADRVISLLSALHVPAHWLELEVTESLLMESASRVIGALAKLSNHGVRIALDDFGKGYSSLTALRKLPISTLKLDKSFVDDIYPDHPESTMEMIADLIRLGHRMQLLVVAEGVEDAEQLHALTQSKCDIIQGYYFETPLEEATIVDRLTCVG